MTVKHQDKKLEANLWKYTLFNAFIHKGKAQPQAVLGKFLAEMPEYRQNAREVLSLIQAVSKEVNKLTPKEQKRRLEENWPLLLVEREAKPAGRRLPPLPNVDRYSKVITRFSPNPDCVLHLGSARAVVLCWNYAQIYGGTFYLRFEDTDPKGKRPVLEFYDSIREDLIWLGCRWDQEFIQSDRLPIYYEYSEKLLAAGQAYICTCTSNRFQEFILAKKPCPCRNLPSEVHLERWAKMLNGELGEGKAVVRVKTDLHHPNPAVRDWPALRVIDPEKWPHPRVGSRYKVWPLYNMSCGLDDHLLGVTHIIRGKEHLTNEQRQRYLYTYLGWEYPEAVHYGRLKITGAVLSKSKIKSGIEEGVYSSYSDPRLATLAALRRRGITPKAIHEIIFTVGPKAADVTLSWDNLYALNRDVVEPLAERYFFVDNPMTLIIHDVKKPYTAKVPLHPDNTEWGFRIFDVASQRGTVSLLISGRDRELLQPAAIIRLKELFNIEVKKVPPEGDVVAVFHSEPYEEARRLQAPVIHYVIGKGGIPTSVVMPDASVVEGVSEPGCRGLKAGQIVQFERFGFVRVDSQDSRLTVYFTHK